MSQKPIFQKLLIKDNYKVLFVNEPNGYRQMLGKLPGSVVVLNQPTKGVDLIQVFVTSEKELEEQLGQLKSIMNASVLLWVTYPKESSKINADINRDVIREYAQSIGLKTVSLISIDDTWSALRLRI
jgi:predicted CoA-binding protein